MSVALKIDPALLLIGEGELGIASDRKGAVPPETRVIEAVSFCGVLEINSRNCKLQ